MTNAEVWALKATLDRAFEREGQAFSLWIVKPREYLRTIVYNSARERLSKARQAYSDGIGELVKESRMRSSNLQCSPNQ